MKLEKNEIERIEGEELEWREGNRRRGLIGEGEMDVKGVGIGCLFA